MEKIKWAFFNAINNVFDFYLGFEGTKQCCKTTKNRKKIIFIFIDYDLFYNRNKKVLSRKCSYPCGRDGLEFVKNEMIKRGVDFIDIITTDSNEIIESIKINSTVHIKNYGSDIGVLNNRLILDVIREYEDIFVINSSASSEELKLVNWCNLLKFSSKLENKNYIIGFNGNSRISPQVPYMSGNHPHVITNAFMCKTETLISQIKYMRSETNKFLNFGFKNKFFCIAFFEIGLSKSVLRNGGDLYIYNKDDYIISYVKNKKKWPVKDSRLIKYGN